MTTVRTISYEYSGDLTHAPQGSTTYAGVELDMDALRKPENLRRFLEQAGSFDSSTQQQSQRLQQQRQMPTNFFSPPSVNASLRHAITEQAASIGRARSLSPALQQRQQQEIDHNYLRRNYQPTWVDKIDEIYKEEPNFVESSAPPLVCNYARRYDASSAKNIHDYNVIYQQQQWPEQRSQEQECQHVELQSNLRQNSWSQKQQESIQQKESQGQCCRHCPQHDAQAPMETSQRMTRETASLSPQKSYRFERQQQQPQITLKEVSDEPKNWSQTTTNFYQKVSAPPTANNDQLLQYSINNRPACTKCHDCGCHVKSTDLIQQQPRQHHIAAQPQEQQQIVCKTIESRTAPKQYYYYAQKQQQPQLQAQPQPQPKLQLQQQPQPQPQQPRLQPQPQPQVPQAQLQMQQNIFLQQKPQQRQIEQRRHSTESFIRPESLQRQSQQHMQQRHGIGYYQMLKQNGKVEVVDSPIQKQQQQRAQTQTQSLKLQQQKSEQQQQPLSQSYYIEHRQAYEPRTQHTVDGEHQSQPQKQSDQQYYTKDQPRDEHQHEWQQQSQHQQEKYENKQPPSQQDYQQQPHQNYNQQQQNYQQQSQETQERYYIQEQPINYRMMSRPQYMHKPTNNLHYSPRCVSNSDDNAVGQQPTFTTAFGDEGRLTVSYRQMAHRSKSEDSRRHHSPIPGVSERGYQYGGMDFIDHDGPLSYRPDDFEVNDGSQKRKSREELPLRRPGDHYGLDFSTHPAAKSLSPTRDDLESYHGYAPRIPRQHWKFSADPNAPLNNYEVAMWDQVDPIGLVGDTLSNQKIASEPPLSEEEKRQFCLEFAPPAGFRSDHRTVIHSATEPEPICMSLSAKKDKLKNMESSTPAAQAQEQYRSDVRVNPANSTNSWYTTGNKEVMYDEPNWSRNVVLRTQAWENGSFDRDARPNWQGGRIQQHQRPLLQHNEQQRMTQSAHWVKHQENKQQERPQQQVRSQFAPQKVKVDRQEEQNDQPHNQGKVESKPQQPEQSQLYPKHPQQQYVQQWRSNSPDKFQLAPEKQKQEKTPERNDESNDAEVVVEVEEIEQPQQQTHFLQRNVVHQQHPQEVTHPQYQMSQINPQFTVQEMNYYQTEPSYKVMQTTTMNAIKNQQQQSQQPQYYVSKQQTIYQQPASNTRTAYVLSGTTRPAATSWIFKS